MIYNYTSRLILHLIFNDYLENFKNDFSAKKIAISPLLTSIINSNETYSQIIIATPNNEIHISITSKNLKDLEKNALNNYIHKQLETMQFTFQYILKKYVAITYDTQQVTTEYHKKIIISLLSDGEEKDIQVLIPLNFFKLFNNKIETDSSNNELEKRIINFFLNPKILLPNLETLLPLLSDKDLHVVLYQLIINNLLTPYQIFLLIKASTQIWENPDIALKIKKCLSKNIISDALEFNKYKQSLNISKKDMLGGVYSIEEAIYFLFNNETSFSYSTVFHSLKNKIMYLKNTNLLIRKDFSSWIDLMITENKLYNVLSIVKDKTIACAISNDEDYYFAKFKPYLSSKKTEEIKNLTNRNMSSEDIITNQILLIKEFKKLKMLKKKGDHKSFEYLLLSFIKKNDYNFLLLNVGWFTLSTALKVIKKNIYQNILNVFPMPAQFLIIESLKGIINPNIIHDEMQIHKAQKICVNAICDLFEDGIIELDI